MVDVRFHLKHNPTPKPQDHVVGDKESGLGVVFSVLEFRNAAERVFRRSKLILVLFEVFIIREFELVVPAFLAADYWCWCLVGLFWLAPIPQVVASGPLT